MSTIALGAFRPQSSSDPFILKNTDRKIRNIDETETDYSRTNDNIGMIRLLLANIESASVSTIKQSENSVYSELIYSIKEKLIFSRNKIIDNPFRFINIFYKKKLRKIDEELDKLDLQLYRINSMNMLNASELNAIVESAEERLKKYSIYLEKANNAWLRK